MQTLNSVSGESSVTEMCVHIGFRLRYLQVIMKAQTDIAFSKSINVSNVGGVFNNLNLCEVGIRCLF